MKEFITQTFDVSEETYDNIKALALAALVPTAIATIVAVQHHQVNTTQQAHVQESKTTTKSTGNPTADFQNSPAAKAQAKLDARVQAAKDAQIKKEVEASNKDNHAKLKAEAKQKEQIKKQRQEVAKILKKYPEIRNYQVDQRIYTFEGRKEMVLKPTFFTKSGLEDLHKQLDMAKFKLIVTLDDISQNGGATSDKVNELVTKLNFVRELGKNIRINGLVYSEQLSDTISAAKGRNFDVKLIKGRDNKVANLYRNDSNQRINDLLASVVGIADIPDTDTYLPVQKKK
jgi:hypothetical protein